MRWWSNVLSFRCSNIRIGSASDLLRRGNLARPGRRRATSGRASVHWSLYSSELVLVGEIPQQAVKPCPLGVGTNAVRVEKRPFPPGAVVPVRGHGGDRE